MEPSAGRPSAFTAERDSTREAFKDSVHAIVGRTMMSLLSSETRTLSNDYGDTRIKLRGSTGHKEQESDR